MKYDIIVKQINKDDAVSFIQKYHYSKIMPRLTKIYLGIFVSDELSGVVTLGWGTQPLKTIKKIFYKHQFTTNDYYEIGKMCFLPKYNNDKNFGSRVLHCVIVWLRRASTKLFLYTLADGIMGKCGYVYQASNFRYLGSFATSVYIDNNTGEKIHPRSSKQLLIENAKWKGKEKLFWLTEDFLDYKNITKINGLMFRYIYPLTGKAKQVLSEYPEYNGRLYPKDNDLIFYVIHNKKRKYIEKPNFNMNVFNYNYQKPILCK